MSDPQRIVPLQGASNFRDLGGYIGHAGRPVRWRRLFRSAHLGELTLEDRARLREMGLARALDFRGLHERAAVPYELEGVNQHSLPIEPSVVERLNELRQAGHRIDAETTAMVMRELYLRLVTEQAPRFAEFFEHLLQADEPVVFHCTAGKDRTGVAAALVLMALGVPRAVVMQDFMLSNEHFKPPQPLHSELPREVLGVLWSVQRTFLEAALEAVQAQPGGFAGYLRERLGVSEAGQAVLAERYLAPA